MGKDGKRYPAKSPKKQRETPPDEEAEDEPADNEEVPDEKDTATDDEARDDDGDRAEGLFSHVVETLRKFSAAEKEDFYNKIYAFLEEEDYLQGGDDEPSNLESEDDDDEFDDSDLGLDDEEDDDGV